MTETTEMFKMILTDQWDDPVTTIVGEITIAFAQLEHVLWVLPKRIKEISLAEWDEIAGTVPIPKRCNQIREYFAVKNMDQKSEAALETLLKSVEKVNETRNSVIHGRWGCKKDKARNIISRHRFWRSEDRGIDFGELISLRDATRRIRDELHRFIKANKIVS